MESRHNVSYCF